MIKCRNYDSTVSTQMSANHNRLFTYKSLKGTDHLIITHFVFHSHSIFERLESGKKINYELI